MTGDGNGRQGAIHLPSDTYEEKKANSWRRVCDLYERVKGKDGICFAYWGLPQHHGHLFPTPA